jgi:hypothetical protein
MYTVQLQFKCKPFSPLKVSGAMQWIYFVLIVGQDVGAMRLGLCLKSYIHRRIPRWRLEGGSRKHAS